MAVEVAVAVALDVAVAVALDVAVCGGVAGSGAGVAGAGVMAMARGPLGVLSSGMGPGALQLSGAEPGRRTGGGADYIRCHYSCRYFSAGFIHAADPHEAKQTLTENCDDGKGLTIEYNSFCPKPGPATHSTEPNATVYSYGVCTGQRCVSGAGDRVFSDASGRQMENDRFLPAGCNDPMWCRWSHVPGPRPGCRQNGGCLRITGTDCYRTGNAVCP